MMAKLYDIDVYLVHNIYIYIYLYIYLSLSIYIYLEIFKNTYQLVAFYWCLPGLSTLELS